MLVRLGTSTLLSRPFREFRDYDRSVVFYKFLYGGWGIAFDQGMSKRIENYCFRVVFEVGVEEGVGQLVQLTLRVRLTEPACFASSFSRHLVLAPESFSVSS